MSRPAYVTTMIGTLPGTSTYAGAWTPIVVTADNLWGNGYNQGSGDDRWTSEHALFVAETDATSVQVTRRITGTVADGEYACGFVMSGAVGSLYGDTFLSRLTAPVGATGLRTTVHKLPPGTKRIFIGGCAYSATTGQRMQSVSFPTGSSVTVIAEPDAGTVVCDGAGSHSMASDGFVSVGGVLQGGANATLRAAWASRLVLADPGQLILQVGTNSTPSVLAADYQVGVDEAVRLALESLPLIDPTDVFVMGLLRRSETATTAAYRTAAQAVCTARGCTYIDGLGIFDASDISSDTLHPKRSSQYKLAQAIHDETDPSKKLMMWIDSIPSGSAIPQATGYAGVIHKLRMLRAAALA